MAFLPIAESCHLTKFCSRRVRNRRGNCRRRRLLVGVVSRSRGNRLTVVTPLTVGARFSIPALILIVRVPARPSRVKDISMPSTRRNVCPRRSRPSEGGGFFGQLETFLPAIPLAARRTRSGHVDKPGRLSNAR
jgi:hypothetical protein